MSFCHIYYILRIHNNGPKIRPNLENHLAAKTQAIMKTIVLSPKEGLNMTKRDVARWFYRNYKGAIDAIAILLFAISGISLFFGIFSLLLVGMIFRYWAILLFVFGALTGMAADWLFEFSHTKTEIRKIYRKLVKNYK